MVRIVGGRVVDPVAKREIRADVLIENGVIAKVAPAGELAPIVGIATIDATGLLVMPGAVDMHVHPASPASSTRRRSSPARAPRSPAASRAWPAWRTRGR
jgi:dihydroorotase-like cyclic amidohydrolase